MIVSHTHRFIFIKTTKTAGTSIELALSRFCGPHDIITPLVQEDEELRAGLDARGPQNFVMPLRHNSTRDWLRLLSKGKRRQLFNHAPASLIREHVGESVWNSYFKFAFERDPFDKAISRYYWSTSDPRPSISEYLSSAPAVHLSNWNTYTINDTVAVDMVGRYETLTQDLAVALKRVGLPPATELPNAKGGYRTDRRHYSELLDSDSRARIETVCAKEIQAFDYQWRDASRQETG